MAFRVDLTERAARDLAHIYEAINAIESERARAWFNGLEQVIRGLADYPARGTRAAEDGALRQVLHGRKGNVYRIIYGIDERRRIVTVLHIRHGARDALAADDLE